MQGTAILLSSCSGIKLLKVLNYPKCAHEMIYCAHRPACFCSYCMLQSAVQELLEVEHV